MNQIFINSISNVRMVVGTIRMDVMNITGQTDDKNFKLKTLWNSNDISSISADA